MTCAGIDDGFRQLEETVCTKAKSLFKEYGWSLLPGLFLGPQEQDAVYEMIGFVLDRVLSLPGAVPLRSLDSDVFSLQLLSS